MQPDLCVTGIVKIDKRSDHLEIMIRHIENQGTEEPTFTDICQYL